MNKIDEHHVGYCGTEQKEILHTLKTGLSDIPFEKSFLTFYEDRKLIGVIGFDGDKENETAEIWGPFIKDEHAHLTDLLWEKFRELLPQEIRKLAMFINKKNSLVQELAVRSSFHNRSVQVILEVDQLHSNLHPYTELSPEYTNAMIQLHDLTFPGTYYNGSQIIERINKHRKVFILTEKNCLLGYIYVEVKPDFGDASIEFFAIKSTHRSKGLGVKLLNIALSWIFTFPSIQTVQLCVESTNQKAISLYKKAGFQIKYELNYFVKEL